MKTKGIALSLAETNVTAKVKQPKDLVEP